MSTDPIRKNNVSMCTVGLEARERFLQFIDVSSGQTADHIISAVFNCFQSLNINMNTLNIVAQSYDGASVMSGHHHQSKIRQQFPCATHCMAHRLNLIVVDMCKGIKVLISLRLLYKSNNNSLKYF